ncbi:MAG TPA: hypothetical protein VKU60_12395 [Chloroflexota bacterium]|nr:hypothetical protein [Chloroflexota bacterium]
MEMMSPLTEVQQLYKEWQDGKLLDKEERQALRGSGPLDSSQATFAELLKGASDPDSTR